MSGGRWGRAAPTFFGTPFIGGVVVLARAYRDAYRAEYLPRRRHTMRSTTIAASAAFIGLMVAFGG